MANVVGVNPWCVDTASADPITSGWIKVVQFEFTGYAQDADEVVVEDNEGNVVWQENGASDLRTVRSGKIGWIHGIAVTTLTSGAKLLVYVE